MTNQEILEKKYFAVVGDTTNPEKAAFKIKKELLDNGYAVVSIPEEFELIDDIKCDIDVLDLCINPVKGLNILKRTKKNIPFVLIQPGAGSVEVEKYLNNKGIEFRKGCILKILEWAE